MSKKEPRLIKVKMAKKIIFVGDTHGDLEASQRVVKDYLKLGNKIVFLGDYVDRGPYSRENIDFLLKTKEKYQNQIYLLQGNHEGHRILKFSPAEFWEGLSEADYEKYTSIIENFPLIVATDDIIALHGALPNIKSLKDINEVKLGSKEWQTITWGDFYEGDGKYLGMELQNTFTGRPQFGRDWFFKLMERFNKKVLIRSHQPDVPQFMFDDRCLTIFTSSAYTRTRTIAIADLTKEIKTAKDLEIKII
jgi:predicted phosphodiesterase